MDSATANQVGMKQRVLHEIKQFLAISIYLTVFFGVFKWYKRLILAEYQIDFLTYGYVILQSLALAKIILTGEALRLGRKYQERPLIVTTVIRTVMFSALAWAFDVLEHLLLGWVRGKELTEVLQEFLDKGWPHILAMTLVVFVAFLPFFAFRELERVWGERELHNLFFQRRESAKLGQRQDAGE
jgi:hypothetical protein